MAQINVFDLDSVCLLSELNPKEAEALNGGFDATYSAYRLSGAGMIESAKAAIDAYERVRKDRGDGWFARQLARAASLSTSA